MSNLIIWAHNSTVDYNYSVRKELHTIVRWLLDNRLFCPLGSEPQHDDAKKLQAGLQRIRGVRAKQDEKFSVTEIPDALQHLKKVRHYLEKEGVEGRKIYPDVEIGGDPAISAIRGYMLRLGPDKTDLPDVCYAGLLPASVKRALKEGVIHEGPDILKNVFRVVKEVNDEPESIGLEADIAKLIFSYGPGRALTELAIEGCFDDFVNRVSAEMSRIGPTDRVIFAISPGRPDWVAAPPEPAFSRLKQIAKDEADAYALYLEKHEGAEDAKVQLGRSTMYEDLVRENEGKSEVSETLYVNSLIDDIKKQARFPDRVLAFVGTRPFGGEERFARRAFTLLRHADIISANEGEVHDLHTVAKGGKFMDIPLAYKLRELPFNAIKVCHSANGAILDLGRRPEEIITSNKFREDPSAFLEEVLRLSADGASYAMDAPSRLGRSANESMVRIYSRYTKEEHRQHERFAETFLDFTESMPAGMIAVPAARVVRPLGAVVGLGAVFDGLLLSFLMRD